MKAVVMAGGEGSRLRPLTLGLPKPLAPICNRPIMEHILGLLKRHGIENVIATIHYRGDQIRDTFGDGSEYGVNLTYSLEDMPLGTAGSVKRAEALLDDGTFLIISGDCLTDCDLTKAIAFHREKNALATLVLNRVTRPLDFGIVITDAEGRIERFLEKPGWSEVFSDTVNTGIYILEPEIFQHIEPDANRDWSQDIFPQLVRDGKPIYGYVMDGYWTDIGSHMQYREAHEHVLSGMIQLPFFLEEPKRGISMDSSSTVDPRATLAPPVCIGRNCRIKEGAVVGPYTVLGDNVVIERDALAERSIIWNRSYLGSGAKVESAIIGSRTTLKRDTHVQEDAVIGDRCLIDVACTIRPGVKIWPDKIIERGSTVTMSLIWGNRWRGSLFRDLGVAGLSNIEITPDFATRLGSAFGSILPDKSKVVTSRDSTRSSRMIKRAIIASLLSVGCDVLDLRAAAAPVARHFVRASGAAGAVHVRKLPGNSRVTLVEAFDSRGAYVSRDTQRSIESAFYREDFNRTDSDDLGMIETENSAVEGYQADFMRSLGPTDMGRHLRIVCDYGYSSFAAFFPAMLARMDVESISLNGYNDAKLAPRSPKDVEHHLENLRQIVGKLGYDMGALFTDEGERLTIVDDKGRILTGNTLFAVLCLLIAETKTNPTICMSITAPSRLETALKEHGADVIRTKADAPALISASLEAGVTFAGDDAGGYIFPDFHPGFDAAFSLAKLVSMLRETGLSLSQVAATVPEFQLAYRQVSCPWEAKGRVMRRISEEQSDQGRLELLDGVKIYSDEGWVLVLPDAIEPLFHIYAESADADESAEMASSYAQKVQDFATSGS